MRVSRRIFIGGGLTIGAATVAGIANPNLLYSLLAQEVEGGTLSAPEVHAAALAGDITLIDIRRPDEWSATGSGEGAHRLDLRRADFVGELAKLTGGDRDAPIALICARGVRSSRLANRLTEAGFTQIIDVPEGMLGSAAGPGWLARGLPVVTDN